MKLRRRVAILNPSSQASGPAAAAGGGGGDGGGLPHPAPRFLPGNHSHSLIVAWYDLPRVTTTPPAAAAVCSLHCVELTDLHHYTFPSDRNFQENSPVVDFGFNHPTSHSSSSDATAYADYFLLHDTVGISSSPLSRSNHPPHQKSNLCEGIGADTGLLSPSIISSESLRMKSHQQQNDELNVVIRKGLVIITADGSIISCHSPEVSVTSLYTTAPVAPTPSTDILQILLKRSSGESSLDECYSALLIASNLLSDSSPSEGIFSIQSIERILQFAIQASTLILESNGLSEIETAAIAAIPSASGLLSSKIQQHGRLREVTNQILKFSPIPIEAHQSFLQLTNALAANHHLLLGSLSLSSQLQEIRKRNESKSLNRAHRISSGGSNSLGSKGRLILTAAAAAAPGGVGRPQDPDGGGDRDRLMQLGEEELMKLIQQGLQTEINSRERDHLFPIDYLREGWSAKEIFFVQPLHLPRGLLTIFTGLSEQYRHLSGGGRQTAAASSSSASSSSLSIHQLLATSYCFCSLLLSIIQSPLTSSSSSLSQEEAEMDEGAKAGKSHRHHSLGSHRQSETQHEWNQIQNSLSLVCRPEVRKCVAIALESFQYSYDLVASPASSSASAFSLRDFIRLDWEGNRLVQLSSAILMGYECHPPPQSSAVKIALSSADSPLHQVNPMHLHEDYHQAKLRSVGVLLSIHAFEEAYELSMRFHCLLGVMNSVWSSSSSTSQRSVARSASHSNLLLLPQLHRQLTDSSSLCGVIDPFPSVMQFGRFCLEWLEQHSRYQEILDLGRYTPHHLQEFLKSRPYLAWIQNLSEGKFLEAARHTSLYCSGEMIDPKTGRLIKPAPSSSPKLHESKPQSLETTKTLLNISKLSSWLEVKKYAEAAPPLHIESKEPERSPSAAAAARISFESWNHSNRSLLSVRAQQLIHEKRSSLLLPLDGHDLPSATPVWIEDTSEHVPYLLQIAQSYLGSLDDLVGSQEIHQRKLELKSSLLLTLKLLQSELVHFFSQQSTGHTAGATHRNQQSSLLTKYLSEFWKIAVGVDASQWIQLAGMNSSPSGPSCGSLIYDENKMIHGLRKTILFSILSEELWNSFNLEKHVHGLLVAETEAAESSSTGVAGVATGVMTTASRLKEWEESVRFSLEILKSDSKILDFCAAGAVTVAVAGESESVSSVPKGRRRGSHGKENEEEKDLVKKQIRNMISRCIQLAHTDCCSSA